MNNKMAITTYLATITITVNGLNAPIKKHRVAEWIIKQNSYMCCLQDLLAIDTHRLKVKGWKRIFHENGNKGKSWGSNTYIRQNKL